MTSETQEREKERKWEKPLRRLFPRFFGGKDETGTPNLLVPLCNVVVVVVPFGAFPLSYFLPVRNRGWPASVGLEWPLHPLLFTVSEGGIRSYIWPISVDKQESRHRYGPSVPALLRSSADVGSCWCLCLGHFHDVFILW